MCLFNSETGTENTQDDYSDTEADNYTEDYTETEEATTQDEDDDDDSEYSDEDGSGVADLLDEAMDDTTTTESEFEAKMPVPLPRSKRSSHGASAPQEHHGVVMRQKQVPSPVLYGSCRHCCSSVLKVRYPLLSRMWLM